MNSSLYEKALSILLPIDTELSTIIVAILRADKRECEDIQQGDFVWVLCYLVSYTRHNPAIARIYHIIPFTLAEMLWKVPILKVHDQYRIRQPDGAPRSLEYNGHPVAISATVDLYHEPGNNFLAFRATAKSSNDARSSYLRPSVNPGTIDGSSKSQKVTPPALQNPTKASALDTLGDQSHQRYMGVVPSHERHPNDLPSRTLPCHPKIVTFSCSLGPYLGRVFRQDPQMRMIHQATMLPAALQNLPDIRVVTNIINPLIGPTTRFPHRLCTLHVILTHGQGQTQRIIDSRHRVFLQSRLKPHLLRLVYSPLLVLLQQLALLSSPQC